MNNNPLLNVFNTPYQTPPFSSIKEEHYLPAFTKAMELGKQELKNLLSSTDEPTFSSTIEALENMGQQLRLVSDVFFNLNHAQTNEQIQTIARDLSPLLTAYDNDIWLNEPLFERVKHVFDNQQNTSLTAEQKKLLEDTYKSFVRRGAQLSGSSKVRYREITEELSRLSLLFGENVLAETNAFQLHVTEENELNGLPEGVMDAASELAKSEGKEGWIFTLQYPSFFPFMKYATNRSLRKTMYMAHAQRCNNNNTHDNKEVVKAIVNLRIEKAQLLGYKSHADFVLEEHMALNPQTVNSFLNELLDASLAFGKNDVAQVADFAKTHGLNDTLQRWDYSYYSEKLKEQLFGLDDEATRPYFELEKVENGVLGLAEKLYGIYFKENTTIDKYHPEVKVYEVFDKDGQFLSVFYADYHPRASKQGGAWMTSFRDQYTNNGKDVRPHISIVCNFTRPTSKTPSLLTFSEVQTFLHEFGHALHGMLSKVTYQSLSGTNVYRDFVELPSQILENWATQKEWLQDVGVHYKTGEVIPEAMIQKLIASDNFQSGYATLRQLSFGFTDMAWHSLQKPLEVSVLEFEKTAMKATELFPSVEGTALSTAFSHIFDGGYAAGYYGYKWAEVLDADAFDLFLQNGIFDRTTAQRFRTEILERGGTDHPMTLYKNFRGQEPSIKPLLKRSGMLK